VFVYKMHNIFSLYPCNQLFYRLGIRYLVSGYQQYSHTYPQILCITFSYLHFIHQAIFLKTA